MPVKQEVRVLGVDDAPFSFEDERTELIGTVYRGGSYLEAVMKRDITVDGLDVTAAVVSMVQDGRHTDQVQAVMLDGITFAGFNVVDLQQVANETGCGVIAVTRNEPDRERMLNGLQHVDTRETRERLLDAAGTVEPHETPVGTTYFQCAGISPDRAHELLDLTCFRTLVPEPVRAAHLFAAALKNGESKGNP